LYENEIEFKTSSTVSDKIFNTDTLSTKDLIKLNRRIKLSNRGSSNEWFISYGNLNNKFVLKHKDISVLKLNLNRSGTISACGALLNAEHMPVGTIKENVVDIDAIDNWWKGRSIPASRDGLRHLLDTLDIYSPHQLLDKSFGLSLSDQYWICPEKANINWTGINFFDNDFSEDIGDLLFEKLHRKNLNPNTLNLISPDNTTDGVLHKKWKIINNKRCLIKGGTGIDCQEVANEVLASSICKRLGIYYVNYKIIEFDDNKYSICEDFITRDTELVTAWHIKKTIKNDDSTSDFNSLITKAEDFGIKDVRRHFNMMLTLDFIIANTDRHYNNFGFIRDVNTLEWLSVAPIYDSGSSMWRGKPIIKATDIHIVSKPFINTHMNQIKLVNDFSWLNFDALGGIDKEYAQILSNVSLKGSISEERIKDLCSALIERIEMLKKIVAKKS
jgi:hypothetical protein